MLIRKYYFICVAIRLASTVDLKKEFTQRRVLACKAEINIQNHLLLLVQGRHGKKRVNLQHIWPLDK